MSRQLLINLAFFAAGFIIPVIFSIFGVALVEIYRGSIDFVEEPDELVEILRDRVVIPDDERPTVGTITDIEALQQANPLLYADAGEGNYVVIFSTKTIIYDKDADKIVLAAPLLED